jgi:hypothetical protein
MTTVYGVTFVGARAQIEKQLRDLEGFPQEKAWGAASYLAKLVCFNLANLLRGQLTTRHHIGYRHDRRYLQRSQTHPTMAQHLRTSHLQVHTRGPPPHV